MASCYGEALEDVRSSIASGKLKLFSQVGYGSWYFILFLLFSDPPRKGMQVFSQVGHSL